MKLTQFSRFAIIQTAFLGDVALTLPLTEAIKQVHPTAEIHFVTTPGAAKLIECSETVDYTHIFDKRNTHKSLQGIRSFADSLQTLSIDCVLAPHRSLRTTLLTQLIKPQYSIGFTKNSLSFLYKRTVEYPIHTHEVERNLRLLSVFEETEKLWVKKAPRPTVTIPEEDSLEVLKILAGITTSKSSRLIAIAPGSVWATKRWDEYYYIETAQILQKKGYTCVFIGGREDEQLCGRLARLSGSKTIAGATTLIQTIAFLKKCAALLTNDSAPTHLAWIAACPTITIYGPTSSIFGFAPRGENDMILENTSLHCRPCAIHGGTVCPLGTHECMKSVTPLIAVRSVQDMLSEKQKA